MDDDKAEVTARLEMALLDAARSLMEHGYTREDLDNLMADVEEE